MKVPRIKTKRTISRKMIKKDNPKVGLTHAGVGWLRNHDHEGRLVI